MDVDVVNPSDHNGMKRILHSYWKISGRSNIKKVTREVYLRSDICCGIDTCQTCPKPAGKALLDGKEPIYILTLDIILKQMASCEKWLRNCLVPTTVVKQVKRRSRRLYNKLKELLEDVNGGYYIFANENFEPTHVQEGPDESSVQRDARAVLKCAQWYANHHAGGSVVLLLNGKINPNAASDDHDMLVDADVDDDKELDHTSLKTITIQELAEMYKEKVTNVMDIVAPAIWEDDVKKDYIIDESGNEKEAIFPRHLSEVEMQRGIDACIYYKGTLTLYVGSYMHGYVSCGGEEYKISGKVHLNRAVHGDLVCVQLIDDVDAQESEVSTAVDDNEGIQDEAPEALLESHMDEKPKEVVKRHCKVLGILKRNWREYCGSLACPEDDKEVAVSYNSSVCTFIPFDIRIPFIYIETKAAKELYNKRIVAVIDSWDRFSHYPNGHWIEIIGDCDDLNVESAVILREHGVLTRDFPLAAYQELPGNDWQIPREEYKRRVDFTNKLVFSVDPPNCKDIDDALGFCKLPNGNLEFSVHIADVTYFVHPSSALDAEASQRCTTVYLVDRRTDMLPSVLTTNLCSLVANEPRLTFSAVWEMTPDGNVVSHKLCKGIIKSARAFTYKQAQDVIDSNAKLVSFIETYFNSDDVAIALGEMNRIAKILRNRRFQRGAVHLESSDVKFEFDLGHVENLEPYILYDTNKMVEEFMLLANCLVAATIHARFPKWALLRRHPPPVKERLVALAHALDGRNLPTFNFENSSQLNESLNNINQATNSNLASAIRISTTRCMSQAIYCCASGDAETLDLKHYGLAVDLYTHFTSPIRRYADVLVHRLLAAAIGYSQVDINVELEQQCRMLNQRHQNAQWCSRYSSKLFAYLYFKSKGPCKCLATVLATTKNQIALLAHDFGIEATAQVSLESRCPKTQSCILKLNDNPVTIRLFDVLQVELYATKRHMRNTIQATILNQYGV